jgi:hypothetical protein
MTKCELIEVNRDFDTCLKYEALLKDVKNAPTDYCQIKVNEFEGSIKMHKSVIRDAIEHNIAEIKRHVKEKYDIDYEGAF